MGEVALSAHRNGPIAVSINTLFTSRLTKRVIEAGRRLGGQFFFNQDLNAGETLGFGKITSFHWQGSIDLDSPEWL